MNRLDPVSGQLVAGRTGRPASGILRAVTWALLAAGPVASVCLGLWMEGNPVDTAARSAALLPVLLLASDVWALAVAVRRTAGPTPLRVPLRSPLIVGAIHLVAGLWAHHLAAFDGLYVLRPVEAGAGIYEVGWWPVCLLAGLVAVSAAVSWAQARMVDWVLVSEQTAAPIPAGQTPVPDEPDVVLGQEHVYEAQMLLHNLGYEVDRIDGELGEATRQALAGFQAEADLPGSGQVTALTMIELRNRWATHSAPRPGQSAVAVGAHALRRLTAMLSRWRSGTGRKNES